MKERILREKERKSESLDAVAEKLGEERGKGIPENLIKEEFGELIGKKFIREQVSFGAMGPVFKIETEGGKKICERDFEGINRYCVFDEVHLPLEEKELLISGEKKEGRYVIDFLRNEVDALTNLQDIPGIPKYYGCIEDPENKRGALFNQFIDGVWSGVAIEEGYIKDKEQIKEIIQKIKDTFEQAAKRGFICTNLSEGIMLDKNLQPYLTEWYMHSRGSIEQEGSIRDLYNEGLKIISGIEDELNRQLLQKELEKNI
jgi:hypothetical protein